MVSRGRRRFPYEEEKKEEDSEEEAEVDVVRARLTAAEQVRIREAQHLAREALRMAREARDAARRLNEFRARLAYRRGNPVEVDETSTLREDTVDVRSM